MRRASVAVEEAPGQRLGFADSEGARVLEDVPLYVRGRRELMEALVLDALEIPDARLTGELGKL